MELFILYACFQLLVSRLQKLDLWPLKENKFDWFLRVAPQEIYIAKSKLKFENYCSNNC